MNVGRARPSLFTQRSVVLTLRIWTLAGAGNILGCGQRGVDGGPETERGVGVHGTLRIFMSYCSVTLLSWGRGREKRSHVWAESPTLNLAPSSMVGSFKQSLAPAPLFSVVLPNPIPCNLTYSQVLGRQEEVGCVWQPCFKCGDLGHPTLLRRGWGTLVAGGPHSWAAPPTLSPHSSAILPPSMRLKIFLLSSTSHSLVGCLWGCLPWWTFSPTGDTKVRASTLES